MGNALHQTNSHGDHRPPTIRPTIESLSEVPSPAAVRYSGERRRPNLGPLHDALVNCGADGWRPMIAMRVGLMECIAHSVEQI